MLARIGIREEGGRPVRHRERGRPEEKSLTYNKVSDIKIVALCNKCKTHILLSVIQYKTLNKPLPGTCLLNHCFILAKTLILMMITSVSNPNPGFADRIHPFYAFNIF